MTERSLVRFGVFELDGRTGELRKHGVRRKLQDQPFQVLQPLLERPGELVTRDLQKARLGCRLPPNARQRWWVAGARP